MTRTPKTSPPKGVDPASIIFAMYERLVSSRPELEEDFSKWISAQDPMVIEPTWVRMTRYMWKHVGEVLREIPGYIHECQTWIMIRLMQPPFFVDLDGMLQDKPPPSKMELAAKLIRALDECAWETGVENGALSIEKDDVFPLAVKIGSKDLAAVTHVFVIEQNRRPDSYRPIQGNYLGSVVNLLAAQVLHNRVSWSLLRHEEKKMRASYLIHDFENVVAMARDLWRGYYLLGERKEMSNLINQLADMMQGVRLGHDWNKLPELVVEDFVKEVESCPVFKRGEFLGIRIIQAAIGGTI